jgi:membrane-bound serine protease (ClpP class)
MARDWNGWRSGLRARHAQGRPLSRRFQATCLSLIAAAGLMAAANAFGQDTAVPPSRGVALLVDVDGAIGPASVRHVATAIHEAQQDRANELIILRMNTPGGLVTSMREMIAAIIASRVPVVGYVAPSGARAASAGTYILYATNIAAMAPGTNVGAATPISLGVPGLPNSEPAKKKDDEDGVPQDTHEAKAVNDAVAFIRSLAELRGRNVKWAEAAVRKAVSISANEALRLGVIDVVADDIDNLLAAIDGFKVKIGKTEQTLATKGLIVKPVEPDTLTGLLNIITDPNVALILMMIGIYGIIFEFFAAPGTFGPGVAGAICLVLGLYALNQLPFNYAGLALLLIGVACMVLEAFTPSFGVLGIGGLVAFVLGAAFLIDTDVPAFQLSWTVIAGAAIASGLVLSVLLGYVWRAMRRPVAGGELGLVGREARVMDWSGAAGHVFVHGERWAARSPEPLNEGQSVRVLRLDGLTLVVAADASAKPLAQPQDQGA